jgi:hypothetical protein
MGGGEGETFEVYYDFSLFSFFFSFGCTKKKKLKSIAEQGEQRPSKPKPSQQRVHRDFQRKKKFMTSRSQRETEREREIVCAHMPEK